MTASRTVRPPDGGPRELPGVETRWPNDMTGTSTAMTMAARDATMLAADVYRPPGKGPWPGLVMRTPYGKETIGARYAVAELAGYGVAVVVQDVRGSGGSEGDYLGLDGDGRDGFDCIEWVASQPWCSGRVGMFGPSAMGATQWSAAALAPPHLVAIAPEVISIGESQRFAFRLHTQLLFALSTARGQLLRRGDRSTPDAFQSRLDGIDEALADPEALLWRLPVTDQPLLEGLAPFYFECAAQGPDLGTAASRRQIAFEQIQVPAFIVGGWFDFTLSGCLEQYSAMRTRSANASAREGTRLLVGPYYHGTFGEDPSERPPGWLDIARGASARTSETRQRWWEWMQPRLHGEGVAEHDARVTVFTVGAGTWRDLEDFPPPDATMQRWYLSSGGQANGWDGDGILVEEVTSSVAATDDRFDYDPADPVRTPGGGAGGVFDMRPLLDRRDVLVYRSAPFVEAFEATGCASVTLSVASSVLDTDFTAALLDVAPDGVACTVADNLVRLRYRNGEVAESVVPGQVYSVTVDLAGLSILFAAGHRMALAVSSSNFPLWDRNPNTGEREHSSGRTEVARQRVLHDPVHPSYLELPVRRCAGERDRVRRDGGRGTTSG